MEDRKQMIKEGNNLWKAKPFFSKKKKKTAEETYKEILSSREGRKENICPMILNRALQLNGKHDYPVSI